MGFWSRLDTVATGHGACDRELTNRFIFSLALTWRAFALFLENRGGNTRIISRKSREMLWRARFDFSHFSKLRCTTFPHHSSRQDAIEQKVQGAQYEKQLRGELPQLMVFCSALLAATLAATVARAAAAATAYASAAPSTEVVAAAVAAVLVAVLAAAAVPEPEKVQERVFKVLQKVQEGMHEEGVQEEVQKRQEEVQERHVQRVQVRLTPRAKTTQFQESIVVYF